MTWKFIYTYLERCKTGPAHNWCWNWSPFKPQGESFARGPKLLSIKNNVIEIMTWKFIYTYRERCKTGPAHNCCWNWSPFKPQGESFARGPKLLSIKNNVVEIMTWKFIYTYRERCKTGPAHNWCWNWSPFTSKHTWMRFSKFWNTFPKVLMLTAWISWRIASLSCSIVLEAQ